MKGVLTGALTSASVIISLTAFSPLAYADNVKTVEISLDAPKAGQALKSKPEIVGVFPREAADSVKIADVTWEGADVAPDAKSGTYNLTVSLEATGDYEFDALATYVVNDSSADVRVAYENEHQATVTTPFKVIADNSLTDLYKICYHENFFDWTDETVKRTPFTSVEVPALERDFKDWVETAEANGYHFACWSTRPWSCDDPTDPDKVTTTGRQYGAGETIELRSDVDLYAQWTYGTYGIIFDANLPDATAPAFSAFPAEGATFSYAEACEELEFEGFVREGYKLIGFSAKRNSTEPDFGVDEQIEIGEENLLLHAVWQADDGADEDDGEEKRDEKKADDEAEDTASKDEGETSDDAATGEDTEDEKSEDDDEDKKSEDDEEEGGPSQKFVGVDVDADGVIDGYEVSVEDENGGNGSSSVISARAMLAQSDDTTYTVRYNANGGDGSMNDGEADPTSAYYVDSPSFTREGYTFGGWGTTRNTSEADRVNPGEALYVENNITLYAQWESDAYKITFDANGGSGAPASRTVDGGTSYTIPKDKPTNDNLAFGGWLAVDTNSIYQPGDEYGIVNDDIAFIAIWGDAYKITFDANGGTGSMDNMVVAKDNDVTLPQNKFKKSGSDFLGWSESPDATAATYADRQMNVTFNNDTTLYAVWGESSDAEGSSSRSSSGSDEDGSTYSISYRANSGSGSMSKQSVTDGESIVLEDSAFKRDGYAFVGWNTSASGSGTSYAPGETVTPTSNMSLYAQWVPSGAEDSSRVGVEDVAMRGLEARPDEYAGESSSGGSLRPSGSSQPGASVSPAKAAPPSTADTTSAVPAVLAGLSGLLAVVGARLLRRERD